MKLWEANNRAIKIWKKVTGFKNATFDQYSDYHQGIKTAQEVDPSPLTTFMILRSTARAYASEQKVDALELLEHPEAVQERTNGIRDLLTLLNDPECQAEVSLFQKNLLEAADVMGLRTQVEEIVSDQQKLPYVRRDALLAFKELKIHHFASGKRGDAKPKYNQNVIKFWNMNSVIAAAQKQPMGGISMVMVRDPVELYSYFCFLVVNGENISVISDLPDQAHPHHKYMSRSRAQERRYAERADRLRFPYQLFDFKFADERGHKKFVGENKGRGIARINTQAVVAKPIKDLDPDQALWAMMMFDLLAEKYWHQEQKPAQLSYTADGMRELGTSSSALILPGEVLLPALKQEDMHRDRLKDVFEQAPTGKNDWMEDRYGHLVPQEAFNLIGEQKTYRLLNGNAIKPKPLVPEVEATKPVFNTNAMGWKNVSWDLSAFEPTNFGLPEQMESDRRWLARYNQAIIVEAEATKEFHARKDEIEKWYADKVKENLPALLKATVIGRLDSEIQGPRKAKKVEHESFEDGSYCWPQPGNILSQEEGPDRSGFFRSQVSLYTTDWHRSKHFCHLSGQQATVWSNFMPWTSKSLSDLAGCKVEELPDVLRHWYRNTPDRGNPILSRLDPMDWKIENPWRTLKFDVTIGLSKRTWKRLVKEAGLPYRELKKADK